MSVTGGRRLDVVWLYFTRATDVKGNVKATCRGCATEICGIVKRMWTHASTCQELVTIGLMEEVQVLTQPASQCSSTTTSADGSPQRKKARQTLLQPLHTDSATRARLDLDVARMIFATRSPFCMVENDKFSELICGLRPGYKPPNRKQVAGVLLNTVYEQEFAKVQHLIRGSMMTLMVDGWTSQANEPVVAISLAGTTGSYLMGVEDTTGKPHTAVYLGQLVRDYLQRAADMGVNVVALTTDSASNMCRMREDLLDDFPKLLTIPCQAHWLHLCARDVVPDSAALDRVVNILRWFSKNHAAHAGLPNFFVNFRTFYSYFRTCFKRIGKTSLANRGQMGQPL